MIKGINKLAKRCLSIIQQREQNGAYISTQPWGLLKHLSSEVSEVHEAYANYIDDCMLDDESKQQYAQDCLAMEVADVIVCALTFSASMNLDIKTALKNVIEKNKLRAEGKGDKK